MDETRTANVELTANVQQYQQGMQQSARQTNAVTESVNKLVASLDGITKRAGKKILLFSAADTAAMTAYTAAAAKYEKQLTTLRAQTELSGKSLAAYKKGINEIARDLPVTGAAVTALVTQINQLGVTSEAQATKMARTFTNLAAATGDDISSLTQGLIELSRQMGTLGNGAKGINNFADTLTTISNQAGVSASAVLSFSQAIAPMARAAGIGQKELMGVATAFAKVGQDGFAAANTFNTIINDITRATQSGSPELGKYATAVGLTVEQFKQLDAAEQFIQIVESVSKAGPGASKMLDRLGIDGTRAAKSIQGLANEAGGLRKAVNDAVGAYGNGSTEKGAAAAFSGLDSEMTKFKNNLEQIAATIGTALLPVATKFMEVINGILDAVNRMAGPLLVVAGAIGGILAPVSAALGGLMTVMGPLSSLMIAMTMFRLSPIRAMIQGAKEGAAATAARAAGVPYVPTTSAGRRMAPGGQGMPSFRSVPYGWGQNLGARVQPSNLQTLVTQGQAGVGRLAPGAMGPAMPTAANIPPSRLGQLALRGGIGASNMVQSWYITPTKQLISNAAMADPFDRVSPMGNAISAGAAKVGPIKAALADPRAYLASLRAPAAPVAPVPLPQPVPPLQTPQQAAAATLRAGGTPAQALAAANAAKALQSVSAAIPAAAPAVVNSAAAMAAASSAATVSMKDFGKSLLNTTRGLAGMPFAYGKMGAQLAMQTAPKVAAGGLSMLGSLVGGGATTGGVLLGAATVAAYGYATKKAMESTQSTFDPDRVRNITATNEALGIATAPVKSFAQAVSDADMRLRRLGAGGDKNGFILTPSEKAAALSADYTDPRFKDLRGPEQARAYIGTMGPLNFEQRIALGKNAWKFAQGNQGAYNTITSGLGNGYEYEGAAASLMAGAQESQYDTWGSKVSRYGGMIPFLGPQLKLAGAFADGGAKEQVTAGVNAISAQAGDVYGDKGEKAGGQTLALELMKAADQIFSDSSESGMLMQQNFLDSLEKAFTDDQDLGVGRNILNGQMRLSGVDITGGASMMEGLKNSAEGSVARGFYDQFFGAETSSTSAAKKNLDAILATNPLSDVERQVQSTSFGRFARTNESVLAATTGLGTQDPKAISDAMEAMLNEVTRGGATFAAATTEIQKFKINLEDTSDFTYTLAQATKAAAERMGEIQARREGGTVGALVYRANVLRSDILRPDTKNADESPRALRERQDAIDQEVINTKIQAYQTLKSWNISIARQEKAFGIQLEQQVEDRQTSLKRSEDEYNLSRVRAMEDFSKQMRRAAEDAARSIYEPFSRVFAPGTIGSDTLIMNLKDQNKKIAEQMKNLKKLKAMGLSQDAIDTLQLTDPKMWAQVQRMIDEGGGNIKGINAEVGKRKGLAKDATQNDMVYGYRNTMEDWRTNRTRQKEDRARQLEWNDEDWDRMRKRQRKQFRISQNQALWDLEQYGKDLLLKEGEIDSLLAGQLNTALNKASEIVRKKVDDDIFAISQVLDELSGIATARMGTNTNPASADHPGATQGYGSAPGANVNTVDNQNQNQGGVTGGPKLSGPVVGPTHTGNPNAEPTSMGTLIAIAREKGLLPANWDDMNKAKRKDWLKETFHLTTLGTGGGITGQTLALLGEKSEKEIVIPLNNIGGKWLGSMFVHAISGEVVKGLRTSGHSSPSTYKGGGGSTHVTTHNNTFRDIKVVAQDPNKMARELKQAAKVERMRKGANA